MTAFLRSASLSNYETVARQFGLNPYQLVREVGLKRSALTNPDLRIPVTAVAELLEISAERSGCDTFGLRMAEARQLANFGALSLLLAHQPTLRDVMDTIARYRNLLNESLVIHIEFSETLVIVREEIVVEMTNPLRQSYELAVGTLFRMIRTLLGPRWQPYSVNFIHSPPPDPAVHRRLFGPHVEFDSDFNGIVLAAADLDRLNPTADPALAQYARQFIETLPNSAETSTTHEVRKAIYLLLPLGTASIARVAESLGQNVRTLQRRLDAEGNEFSNLVNSVRRELALRYLQSKRDSLTHIAESLGYGQLSSFTRWFSGEFGAPPAKWRNSAPRDIPQRTPGKRPVRQRSRAKSR
jgi:AraC-like DNA-binding protein